MENRKNFNASVKKFIIYPRMGICANVSSRINIHFDVTRFISKKFPQYFSGNANFPILSMGNGCEKEYYMHCVSRCLLWHPDTQYGLARREIMTKILRDHFNMIPDFSLCDKDLI